MMARARKCEDRDWTLVNNTLERAQIQTVCRGRSGSHDVPNIDSTSDDHSPEAHGTFIEQTYEELSL